MQDVFLFSDTNENVKLGKRPWVKQEEVIAAHYSQASEFIDGWMMVMIP